MFSLKAAKTEKTAKTKIFLQLDVAGDEDFPIFDDFSGKYPENSDFDEEKAEKLKNINPRNFIQEWKTKVSCDTRPVAPTMNKLCDLIKEFEGKKYRLSV